MAQVDVVDSLARDDVHDEGCAGQKCLRRAIVGLTEVDPCSEHMRIVAFLSALGDVAETQDIKLLLPTVCSSIDREQYRPGDAATDEAD